MEAKDAEVYSNVVTGKLNLKGIGLKSKKKKKKKSKKRKTDELSQLEKNLSGGSGGEFQEEQNGKDNQEEDDEDYSGLTETQIKFLKRQKIKMRNETVKTIGKSYRERINELNHVLSTKTEHNDIPRVSAAGNG
mmetsp:Transcript_2138/g.4120  ORF Transcript_2138/g.4120 Transcript_2138/m.4120 type:complete len:134 (+) Transcript_2138:37-438(+)|eukprot:CAMPEP_0194586514 /NCGR_PEP_ID=MMETSP0292-20121207/18499_1 /TAXON_ID=39354 /ORGANISM="Heterosigma akashiwo, Strain CCMP2393" /LENGTH=133 /DNA_ID=CAMNT_0039442379 /DNA_START=37 /DNA_END=441 /DNA_ORIENTATION=+